MIFVADQQPSSGRKRRFVCAGAFNVVMTNVLLQILLHGQWLPTGLATLISQAFNGFLGYAIYGNWVFQSPRMRSLKSITLYVAMMILLWSCNTLGIYMLVTFSLLPQRNIAALSLIIPLAALSYTLQKLVVFRQPSYLQQ